MAVQKNNLGCQILYPKFGFERSCPAAIFSGEYVSLKVVYSTWKISENSSSLYKGKSNSKNELKDFFLDF